MIRQIESLWIFLDIAEVKPTDTLAERILRYGVLWKKRSKGTQRLKPLAKSIPVCIIDHHLLRSMSGIPLLDEIKEEVNGRVLCAADFMHRQRLFFEADRSQLYDEFPVPSNGHESYKRHCRDRQDNQRFL